MKVMWSTQILRYITCQAFADESQFFLPVKWQTFSQAVNFYKSETSAGREQDELLLTSISNLFLRPRTPKLASSSAA